MTAQLSSLPNTFKGIALFTPGGDLIYGIHPHKQAQWHIHLCLRLQETLGLADSPHFLVPGYTATVERWLNPHTQQMKLIAEVHPAVQRYIPLLQVLFDLKTTTEWHLAPWQEEHCNRAVIETYQPHFPQLWQQHNLIIRFDPKYPATLVPEIEQPDVYKLNTVKVISNEQAGGYILQLFISSNNPTAEQTLGSIHQLLEQGLTSPYTLKVIDIDKNPEQAEINQVIVTPTLVRVAPKPVKRIVGQLDDIQRILHIISSY
ncbi:circadian clock KaiB family protein [Pleurocapsa sp. PCC 7319]|uniref:circadian clock KaiB family protein n=1 Tax=Pleurocapsa sp. PCC 7319 TaxID=118161 RepID=UPI0003480352|nr:circadian clock KaiB family protein [Pleurocapsa sp. PCC 7319]